MKTAEEILIAITEIIDEKKRPYKRTERQFGGTAKTNQQ